MEKEILKIKILDKQTQHILFECGIHEIDNAYAQASLFEEMGLDVIVVVPTLGESLSRSLGHGPQVTAGYIESLNEEMDQHEGSCCFDDNHKDKSN